MPMQRVYHFCNKKYGLENIEKRRLKVSTFLELNDPFELLCHNTGDVVLRRQLHEFKKSVAATNGLICFSRAKTSPVQWAHYSERHTGLCLGFDVPEEFLSDVIYTGSRLNFKRLAESPENWFKAQTHEMFLTKFKHWSYEKETRMFGDLGIPDPESGLFFQSFNEMLVLKEVAVGINSDLTRADLSVALGDLNEQVDSYKVRPGFTKFQMVRNKDEELWM